MMKLTAGLAAGFVGVCTIIARPSITVEANAPGHPISPMLWGIFFEDINLSADGGLYPELVRNRSFEDSARPENWTLTGATASIDDHEPLNTFNLHYLKLSLQGPFKLENEGYWGMNIAPGARYTLKLATRGERFTGPLKAKLVSSTGTTLASGQILGIGGKGWRYSSLKMTATGGDPKAHLELSGNGDGTLCLDMVSLLPDQTWKGHGLRTDLAEALDALHPAFMRFPGGNWIEGDDVAHMYHWKSTIGDIDARTPLWNTWGYNTTQGLGFYEYLQLCEDLGAEPVFGINCGMALNGHSVPLSRMGQWIEDALDAMEYANGPTNSVWGAQRAAAGHPAPFHLRYLEIGNENGGPDYWQRWKLLAEALRAKYPDVRLIVNTSLNGYPNPSDPKPDIVDEHYYESPESFMRRAGQYDYYDRKGPKIFIGEYAVTQKAGLGNLRAAIGEAAFMTGMERNADVVAMASYAPLFVNMNHRAWNPDLINFDSSRWYGLPGYYVQKMFSENRGDETRPVEVDSPLADLAPSQGRIGVGTWNTAAEFKDIKVTAPDGTVLFASDFSKGSQGWKMLGEGDWSVQDGALRQGAEKEFVRALAGDKTWTNYNLSLKARKISGREGFLILFHIAGDDDRLWWNLGGWENTQDGIENGSALDRKPGFIETNRWYDIQLVVQDRHVKAFLDGQLIHDIDYESDAQVKALYACASRESRTGDLIVKIVNASAKPLETSLNLAGAKLTGRGSALVLTSENPTDENTLAEPTRVSPKSDPLNFNGTTLTRTFPGNSFTVLRFPATP